MPSPEPMWSYWKLDTLEQSLVKFDQIQEDVFENAVCKILAILVWPQCVNKSVNETINVNFERFSIALIGHTSYIPVVIPKAWREILCSSSKTLDNWPTGCVTVRASLDLQTIVGSVCHPFIHCLRKSVVNSIRLKLGTNKTYILTQHFV